MSNSTRDRAISLLGQGFSQSQVAIAIGVTDSWISQLVTEPEVHDEISRLRSGALQEKVEADKTLDDLEKRALKLVADKLPFVRSPMEATKIYATLNKANRKTAAVNPEHDKNTAVTVNITLPKAAAGIHIQLNQNNQVVEVEGQSMATLPSRALPSLASRVAQQALPSTVSSVPSIQDIQAVTRKRLQDADGERAAAVLRNLEILIDGVPCVL